MKHPINTLFLLQTVRRVGIAAILVVGTAVADSPNAETSDWKCAQCPFLQGHSGEVEAGAFAASGANATFGRYTGIDHGGTYADLAAAGQSRSEDGAYANYDLERLGLASRDGFVDGGREGRYDLRASYDGQPTRLYDTGMTPFRAAGSTLGLPEGWVAAGSTGNMTALGASLAPVKIESNRRTVALLARYFATSSWTVFGEFRHQEHDGTGLSSGGFLTQAVQIARPFDYVTDSFETGIAWAGRNASIRVNYLGSWFMDHYDSTDFQNPYLAVVPGSTSAQLAAPPGNSLQQIAASGNVQLPGSTSLTYAASIGTLKQNSDFLPVSTLPGSSVPDPSTLGGNIHLSHHALGFASRPIPKLSVRANAIYDGRDDKTPVQAISYVVTDTFFGGTVVTPRYSEDRVHLDGGADYALARWLKIGVGGKLDDIHYGPGQIARWTQNAESWGRATITPIAPLSITFKIGNGLRKASSINEAALPLEETPLIRAYNYAPRDRVFYTLTGSWLATSTLTWTVEGFLAKDDYRSSLLGLQSAHEARASTTLSWSPRETFTSYINAGFQRLFTLQDGNTGLAPAPWSATDTERYWNAGVGIRWVPRERWTMALDYLVAPTYDNMETTAGGLQQAFPQNSTKLDTTHLNIAYQWTAALNIRFQYAREQYHSGDWALNSVGPSTVPNFLALGLAPYRDSVNVFGLTARYQFGHTSSAVPGVR